MCAIHSSEADSQGENDTGENEPTSDKSSASPGTSAAPKEPLSAVPSDLIDSIRGTISGVLDFIIETLSTSPEEISFSRTADEIEEEARETTIALGVLPDISSQDEQMLNAFDRDVIDVMDDEDIILETLHRKVPIHQPGVEDASMTEKNPFRGSISDEDDDEKEIYSLVLWNDEEHSFDDVIRIVKKAIGCTTARARAIAEAVDSHVCTVLFGIFTYLATLTNSFHR
jgi:hypothetical protein